MPVLKNARHERFAQALAQGKSATEAYSQAGFKPHQQNASRLMSNDVVKARVAELQSKLAEKATWSAAERMHSLKSIHDASLTDDRRTAIAAIAEANKMQGSYAPTKRELSGPGGGAISIDLTNVSADDLDRLEALFGPLAGGSGDDDASDQGGEG